MNKRMPELFTENIVLVSRAEAIQQNLVTYFTGIPCGYGHIDEIYVSNGTCKACQRERSREYGRRNIKKIINRQKNKAYGISSQEFEQMILAQNNLCLICEEEFKNTPHLDHNHNTGKIRGILCHNCNTGLGLFKDSQVKLQKAIEYLRNTDGME